MAVKVGDDYVPFSAEAAAKVVDASPLDDSAKGDNRVVVKLDHNTTEKGAYPIVLVSYDVACPAYKDANTAKFVKSWLTYVTSDEGSRPPLPQPAPLRCPTPCVRRSSSPSTPSKPSEPITVGRSLSVIGD
mgnify:FL=1